MYRLRRLKIELKYKLRMVKLWLRYEPEIAFDKCMAKVFHGIAELADRSGYFLFGKERWERAKREQYLNTHTYIEREKEKNRNE